MALTHDPCVDHADGRRRVALRRQACGKAAPMT
jgi:hypothetical protein